MKNMKKYLLGALLTISAAGVQAADQKSKDIVDVAVGAGSFKTLVAAVKAADLVGTLKGDGPFTVFAPTDKAFSKLPKGTLESLLKPENKKKLQDILTYHVVAAKVPASKVTAGKVAMVNKKHAKISIKNGKVMINKANVVKTDVLASNGVIHVIDQVILPPTKKN
tara:strand:+ start:12816 stop:13313 length:498 start_codon:yes stop_codon:yes gene_type:complete